MYCQLIECGVYGSLTDEQLKTLIDKRLVDDVKIKNLILSTNGAIDSFSSRINLAYLMGLIPKNFRDDLELIRRIRNEFAHTAKQMTFESESVKSRCLMLKSAFGTEQMDSHGRFLRTSVVLATKLSNYIADCEIIGAKPDYDDSVSVEGIEKINVFMKEKFNVDLQEVIDSK